jgi:hypothetical protein
MATQKSLATKLTNLQNDPACGDFIIADAKDADMGAGIAAPGANDGEDFGRFPFRSLEAYRDSIREIVEQGLVDIMLMSPGTCEHLVIHEKLFESSVVTPAARANDTTDIWLGQSGFYSKQPSLPFRTTTIDHVQCGRVECTDENRGTGADLGLYSITFNNDTTLDSDTLRQYHEFRVEAEQKGFRHFLEVFAPNSPVNPIDDVPRFLNDCITRTLAGVTRRGRPLFLKTPWFGPAAMEQLIHYDPNMLVGIMGGSSGTTLDAFQMLWQARKQGACAALYGRRINNSEHQPTFVKILCQLANGEIEPREAVRAYRGELVQLGITPFRPLEDDLQLTQP